MDLRSHVIDAARAFLDRHARHPQQRAMMERALEEAAALPGERIPCIHLPAFVVEATGSRRDPVPIAMVTAIVEAGIYTLDHLVDRQLGPHWEGVHPAQIELAGVGFLSALPQLAIAELDCPAELRLALYRDLADAFVGIWAGQGIDLASRDASAEAMLDAVGGKTGDRRALYARLAARYAGADDATCERMAAVGFELGVMRQLTSDVMDLVADPRRSDDLATGTRTWPIAWTREALDGATRAAFDATLEAAEIEPEARVRALAVMTAAGAMIRVKLEVERRRQRALEQLTQLRSSGPGAQGIATMLDEAAGRFTLAAAA